MKADYLEMLRNNQFLRTSEEVQNFEHALDAYSLNPKSEDLETLHLILQDKTNHPEVMFGLIHFLETFEINDQMQAFMNVVPALVQQAPAWTRTLMYRLLNDETGRKIYPDVIRKAPPESQTIMIQILSEIAESEPSPLCNFARDILGQLLLNNNLHLLADDGDKDLEKK